MTYEIWLVVEDNGELMPLTKEFESDNFTQTYLRYGELMKSGKHIITTNKEVSSIPEEYKDGYIFESPDGGKTVYKRKFLSKERELHGRTN